MCIKVEINANHKDTDKATRSFHYIRASNLKNKGTHKKIDTKTMLENYPN